MKQAADLLELLKTHGLPYAVIANISEGQIEPVINTEDVGDSIFVKRRFGDMACVKAVHGYLEGKMLPQIARQDTLQCILSNPVPGVVVGVFYHESRSPVESYDYAEEIDRAVQAIWSE